MKVQPESCLPGECCAPDTLPGRPSLTETQEARLAELCRALAHPARVRIVGMLLAKNMCVAGELADELPLAASTVSEHLRILKESGLIKGEVSGPRRCYCVDRDVVDSVRQLMAAI